MVDKICLYCKKKFIIAYYRRKQKYCSKKCQYEHIRADKTKAGNYGNFKQKLYTCLNCGKVNNINQKSLRKFCNQDCWSEYINKHPEAASNYRHGVYVETLMICKVCGKEFYSNKGYQRMDKTYHIKKYCSKECYADDEKSLLKKKLRKDNMVYGTAVGSSEDKAFDYLEKKFKVKIKRNVRFGKYAVDGYIPNLNLVIEIDERHHKNSKIAAKDIVRQKNIQDKYKCRFIRIREWIKEDLEQCQILS